MINTIDGLLRKTTKCSGRDTPISGKRNSHKILELLLRVC